MMGDSGGGEEPQHVTDKKSPSSAFGQHLSNVAQLVQQQHVKLSSSQGYAQFNLTLSTHEVSRNSSFVHHTSHPSCYSGLKSPLKQGPGLQLEQQSAGSEVPDDLDCFVGQVGNRLHSSGCVRDRSAAASVQSDRDKESVNIPQLNCHAFMDPSSNVKTDASIENEADRKPCITVIKQGANRQLGSIQEVESCTPPVYPSQPCFPQNEARRECQAASDGKNVADQAESKTDSSMSSEMSYKGAVASSNKVFTLPLSSGHPPSDHCTNPPPPMHTSFHNVPKQSSIQEKEKEGQCLAEDCHSNKTEDAALEEPGVEIKKLAPTKGANKSQEKNKPSASPVPSSGASPLNQVTSASNFAVTPSIYSDSDTDEYTEYEQKPVVQDGKVVTKQEKPRKANVRRGRKRQGRKTRPRNSFSTVDSKAGIAVIKEASKNQSRTRRSKVCIKRESACVDKAGSDYELPSHGKSSAKEETVRRILPTRKRKQNVSTSYQESSGDSDDSVVRTKQIRRGTVKPRQSKAVGNKPGNKTCPECQKTFTRAESLTVHMRVHTGERPFRCQQCDATYKVSSHLRNHIRSKHSNTKEYQCANCGKAFSTPNAKGRHEKTCGKDLSERVKFHCNRCLKGFVTSEGFERHKNMDTCCPEEPGEEPLEISEGDGKETGEESSAKSEERPFKCSKCGKTFAEFTSLDCHQRFLCGKVRGGTLYVCPQCNKPFTKWNRYVAHSRRHTGDKPFPCKHCKARFFDRECLRKHVARHEGKNKVKCSLCDKMFSAKSRLSMHIMRFHCGMKPYKCNECDSDFASATLLSTHIRRVHRKEKRFKCQLCDKAFFESQAWMKHMVLHASGKDPTVRGPVQEYPCNLCGKVMNMRLMRLHVETDHPGVQLSEAVTKSLVTCKLCNKEFSDSSSLKIHMIRHSGKKDFKCDQCEMAFVTIHALQIHQRKHTDARPYTCEECGDTFRWRASLRDHKINLHSPEVQTADGDGRRFTCKECGQRFKRYNSLKSHMIRHRSVMPCICSECGKGFTDTTRLKIHMSCHSGSDRPFICETCGAGFFYTFLLKRHIQSRHKPSPWLCNLCGRSLCSKDALKRHIQHHANSPDGKVRVGGNRGRKRKLQLPAESAPKELESRAQEEEKTVAAGGVDGRVEEQYQQQQDNCRSVPREAMQKALEPLPLADHVRRDFIDLSTSKPNEMQPSCNNVFMEQSYPYPSTSYIINTVQWPKPEGH